LAFPICNDHQILGVSRYETSGGRSDDENAAV